MYFYGNGYACKTTRNINIQMEKQVVPRGTYFRLPPQIAHPGFACLLKQGKNTFATHYFITRIYESKENYYKESQAD